MRGSSTCHLKQPWSRTPPQPLIHMAAGASSYDSITFARLHSGARISNDDADRRHAWRLLASHSTWTRIVGADMHAPCSCQDTDHSETIYGGVSYSSRGDAFKAASFTALPRCSFSHIPHSFAQSLFQCPEAPPQVPGCQIHTGLARSEFRPA